MNALQDKLKLVPLSQYGKAFTPPAGTVASNIDMKRPVREQVNRMDGSDFFTMFAQLLNKNPPAAADAPMVAKLAKIGIRPGQPFDLAQLDPTVALALRGAPPVAGQKIMAADKSLGKKVNGWMYSLKGGKYGTDYTARAFFTLVGLGANLPQDAVYPITHESSDGQPLNGANRYVIHFAKGQLPPVKGFWSVSLYNDHPSSSKIRSTAFPWARARRSRPTATARSTS